MRKVSQKALEARAKMDADRGDYFAVRKLLALPGREPVLVGLVGPYDLEGFPGTTFFADVRWPGNRLFVSSVGDRFQAVSLGVELCRVHLILLLRQYPEGLLEESGEYYQHYDFPTEPATPPPLDFSKIKLYRPRRD